jgi:pimeloyl-ACP methyl ester carboxylesterase
MAGERRSIIKLETETLSVICAGRQGPPVLLLHGGGTDAAALSWGPLIADLGRDYRVIAPDLPGYGCSPWADVPHTPDYYVNLIVRLLDTMEVDCATVIGVSMGGGIALGLGLQAPERVHALVPIASYGLQRMAPLHRVSWLAVQADIGTEGTYRLLARNRWLMRQSVAAIFGEPRRLTTDLVDELQLLMAQPGVGRAFRAFQRAEVGRHGLRTVYMDQLGRIRAPTFYIHGTHDTLVPVACAQEAQRRTPGALLYLLRRVGHWPQREVPLAFNQLVRAFLQRIAAHPAPVPRD